ncbi:phosphotransferase family protein [Tsuneonella sp. CC-YZS046]|uniref:phosphotransferase family protein n=1 Tax=Tsuneonella sp. CC-YZS046 TaxID=3042152 RepID=UPI002D797B59|nr:phosphotransferase family protein [Tsuneonella sp. CC-YZS046]WRO66653.1 phosphotransferase family protein [Tsuneonella sp. CC-YZS046]
MKITETADYLRVAIHTLETKIAPEMTSSDGQAAAAILGRVLTELRRREEVSAPVLAASVSVARQLAKQLRDLAADNGVPVTVAATDTPDQADFSSLALQHAALTQEIEALSSTLASRRSDLKDAAAQDQLSALLLDVGQWDEAFPSGQRTIALPAAPEAPPLPGESLSQDLLQAFLRSVHPDGDKVEIIEFKPIPGGFGKQTSRATYRDASGVEHFVIIRKSDPTPMARKGAFLVDYEFHLLRDVYKTGILPMAEPLWLAKDFPGVDADFYVMSALPGAVPSSFLGAASASIPEEIILDMAEKMAKLHQMELSHLTAYLTAYDNPTVLNETIEDCYRRLIGEWKDYYEQNNHLPSPFVVYLLDWLDRNIPPNDASPVLVHGDFNVHNVLVDNGRITGVLDWECSNIGAPEQDLAYIRPIISQHIDWNRFIDHYEASGGRKINRGAMDFYMAFAAMRLCVIFNKGVKNLQDGVNSDIRYGIIDLDLTPEFMKQALVCTLKNYSQ